MDGGTRSGNGCDKDPMTTPTDDQAFLAERFETHRPHLRGVAYRMLGSLSEADDAVQEAWIRLSRTDTSDVDNLRAWLTTVVGRVCLNLLRTRRGRREASFEMHVPDPIVGAEGGLDPEQEALLGDSVGLALLVVLESLSPAERVAFVLHDVFAVPFDDIAPIVGRSSAATRQLASRGRRRVQGAPVPDADLEGQWAIVEAFLAAARDGDFERLLDVLDPDVTLRSDGGTARPGLITLVHGRGGRRDERDGLPGRGRERDPDARQRDSRRRRVDAGRPTVRGPGVHRGRWPDRRDRRARRPGPARVAGPGSRLNALGHPPNG